MTDSRKYTWRKSKKKNLKYPVWDLFVDKVKVDKFSVCHFGHGGYSVCAGAHPGATLRDATSARGFAEDQYAIQNPL